MDKTYIFQDFCKRRKITPEWLASEKGSLEVDADRSRLPEDELVVGGDLTIHAKRSVSLPPTVRVGGNLVLDGSGFESLPEQLEVGGTLYITDTHIQEIPPGCQLGGMIANNAPLQRLPEHWRVPGTVQIEHCPYVELPAHMEVGALTIRNCLVSALPTGLHVHGCLDISESFIHEIPADCQVGSLLAANSALCKLPANWQVMKSVILCDSAISELPDGLSTNYLNISGTKVRSIPKSCKLGSLNASRSCLALLPDHWFVKGNVWLDGCIMLTALPTGLCVGELLSIKKTRLKEIPSDCKVGELDASDSALERIPEHWQVNGGVRLIGCQNFKTIPAGLTVGGLLNIQETGVTEIPADCRFYSLNAVHSDLERFLGDIHVPGYVNVGNCHIIELPTKIRVGDALNIEHTPIQYLPDDCMVGKKVFMKGCPIRIVPERVICADFHCDKEVQVLAYRFNKVGVDVHPNGLYCAFKGSILRIQERKEDFIRCLELSTDKEVTLQKDRIGRYRVLAS